MLLREVNCYLYWIYRTQGKTLVLIFAQMSIQKFIEWLPRTIACSTMSSLLLIDPHSQNLLNSIFLITELRCVCEIIDSKCVRLMQTAWTPTISKVRVDLFYSKKKWSWLSQWESVVFIAIGFVHIATYQNLSMGAIFFSIFSENQIEFTISLLTFPCALLSSMSGKTDYVFRVGLFFQLHITIFLK